MTLPDVHPLQADHNQDQALSDVWRELERGMADLQGLPARGPQDQTCDLPGDTQSVN
jgi:hypothetical protein